MKKDCGNCFYSGRPSYEYPCSACTSSYDNPPTKWELKSEPKTNGDRIRAMTDEELAAWGKVQIGCGFDFFPCGVVCDGKCESYDNETCKAKILKWLQQPVED